MPDHLTKEQRSYLMRQVRSKGSKIERMVFLEMRRSEIYFQMHYKRVPGTPDLARPSEKKAVFIHSDFWHGWRLPAWSHKLPSNFWREKLSANRARDRRKLRQLRALGWTAIVVWEHSLKKEPEVTLARIADFLSAGMAALKSTVDSKA